MRSVPFWSVSRDHRGEERRIEVGLQAGSGLQRRLADGLGLQRLRGVVRRQQPVGAGIPDLVVHTVEDAAQLVAARAQEPS